MPPKSVSKSTTTNKGRILGDSQKSSYLTLKARIRQGITDGELPRGSRIPSVRKLAADESVSPATVQRALRELIQEGHLVSEDRRGVFVADEEIAPAAATVGLLLSRHPDSLDTMHLPLFQELQKRLLNSDAVVVTMLGVYRKYKKAFFTPRSVVADRKLQAAVLIHVMDLAYIASLIQLGIPIVATDLDASDIGAHSVFFDNLGSAHTLTHHLIERGHERILYLGGVKKSKDDQHLYDVAVRERYDGFRIAMEASGLSPDLTAYASLSRASDKFTEALEKVLEAGTTFSAVVTESPLAAVDCLEKAGRRDIEVVGWLDRPISIESQKVLTDRLVGAAICDFTELGKRAFKTLNTCLTQPGSDIHRDMVKPRILLGGQPK